MPDSLPQPEPAGDDALRSSEGVAAARDALEAIAEYRDELLDENPGVFALGALRHCQDVARWGLDQLDDTAGRVSVDEADWETERRELRRDVVRLRQELDVANRNIAALRAEQHDGTDDPGRRKVPVPFQAGWRRARRTDGGGR